MSGNSEPVAAEQIKSVSLSHARILWTMGLVVIAGTIAGFIFVGARFGLGILLGGGLAFVNYYWLKRSLRSTFEKSGGGKSHFLSAGYFLRYAAAAFVLYVIYLSGGVPVIAVLFGWAAFAPAVFVEGLILIFSSIFRRRKF